MVVSPRLRGIVDQPADGQRLAAIGAHFDRHLIGGATDAAGPDFERRLNIVERVVEHRQSGS